MTAGWEPRQFTASELQFVVQGMAKGKAPRHDGWQVQRLRQWLLAIWSCIAILFKAVEDIGRWPSSLRGGVVCLLPKAGVQATT